MMPPVVFNPSSASPGLPPAMLEPNCAATRPLKGRINSAHLRAFSGACITCIMESPWGHHLCPLRSRAHRLPLSPALLVPAPPSPQCPDSPMPPHLRISTFTPLDALPQDCYKV